MTIIKSFGYGNGSPYTSSTFNQNNDLIFNTNGPLIVATITNVGLDVVLTNLTFIQQGVIVESIGSVSIPRPASLPAPYYLVATIPDTRPIDNVVWGFLKSPQDITENTVVIAAYDGQEWNPLPMMDAASSLAYRRESAIAWNMIGLNDGFQFLPDFSAVPVVYNIGTGVLTDTWGELISKNKTHTLPEIPIDPTFTRIDAVIYRRDTDALRRIGQFEVHPGPGYLSDTLQNTQQHVISGAATENYRLINPPDDTLVILYLQGGVIYLTRYSEDRATVEVAPRPITSLGTTITLFDCIYTGTNRIYVALNIGSSLYGLIVDTDGLEIVALYQITVLAAAPLSLVVNADYTGNLYIGTLVRTSSTTTAPFLSRLDAYGVPLAPTISLFTSSVEYSSLDFIVDQDIDLVFVLSNATDNSIEQQTFNSVGMSYPAQPRVVISDKTVVDGVALATNAPATMARIAYSDTGYSYVTFLQTTATGEGIALYSNTYEKNSGYKAHVLSDTIGTLQYDFDIDWSDNGYLLYATTAGTFYYNFSFYTIRPYMASGFFIAAPVATPVAPGVIFDRRGALATAYQNATLNTSKLTPDTYYDFEDMYQTLLPSDFFVGYIQRSSDPNTNNIYIPWYGAPFAPSSGVGGGGTAPGGGGDSGPGSPPASSGGGGGSGSGGGGGGGGSGGGGATSVDAAIQKTDSLLYCQGVFTYAAAPSTTLSWSSSIQIADPYRCTYTILAGSMNMPSGQVLFVQLPASHLLTSDGGSQGPNTVTIADTNSFSTGQAVFLGQKSTSGLYTTVAAVVDSTTLRLASSTSTFLTVDGAYLTKTTLVAKSEQQNGPTLRPGSTGYISPDLYILAECMGTQISFRNGGLTLMQGYTGRLGTTTTQGVTLNGGFTSYDINYQSTTDSTNKLLGQARLRQYPTNPQEVFVTPILQTMNSGATLGQMADNIPLIFDGCLVNPAAGTVTTLTGVDMGMPFPPVTNAILPVGRYLWGAITLIVGANNNALNYNNAAVVVSFGSATGASLATAPYATYDDGIPVGEFYLVGTGTAAVYSPITYTNIIQIGAGGGGGGGGGGGAWKAYPKATDTPNIQTIANGGTLTLARKRLQYWRVQGTPGAGACTMSITPFGNNNLYWKDADAVRLIGMSNTDYPVINNSVGTACGIDCNGIIELKLGKIVELQYDAVRNLWSDPARNF